MTSLAGRHIELWIEPRAGAAAVNPIVRQLLDGLSADGATVRIRVPEHHPIDPMHLLDEAPPDLVLLKTATSLAMSVAIADEAHGARFLNGARASWRAHDKAAAIARLAAAGLPVPPTFVTTGPPASGQRPPGSTGAWVAKPVYGVHGHDVTFHATFPAAVAVPTEPNINGRYVVDDGTRLVQQRIGGDAADIKVYVANRRCFAGRKRFGPESYASDSIEPLTLDGATTELTHAAGDALDLRCFGVDLRLDRQGPVIVDVNPFPGYRGFPDAVPALRAEIERALAESPL